MRNNNNGRRKYHIIHLNKPKDLLQLRDLVYKRTSRYPEALSPIWKYKSIQNQVPLTNKTAHYLQ